LSEAADFIANAARISAPIPMAVILGSGLGAVTELIVDSRTIAYSDIPGFPRPSTPGHSGHLVVGSLPPAGAGTQMESDFHHDDIVHSHLHCFLSGRSHFYEGHDENAVAFAIRTLRELGVRQVLLCSAAGGIATNLAPGALMLVNDILNFSFRNPLIGPIRPDEARFPDMGAPFDSDMSSRLLRAASSNGILLREGVYASMLGPSYETSAEIQMLQRLGADAVGMSTVPEVIVARANGLRVAAVCCITNRAAGLNQEHGRLSPLTHDEVVRVARESEATLRRLLTAFLQMSPL
jgi:purine-nucleoside phosphorylase